MKNLSQEKCRACHQLGHSCCHTQPVMTENEAAKIYYKHGDLVPSDVQLTRVQNNVYIFAPKSIVTSKGVQINSQYCVFFDQETSKCKIYEDRPSVCQNYGDRIPCPFINTTIDEMNSMSKEDRLNLVKSVDTLTEDTLNFTRETFQNALFSTGYKLPKFTKKYLKHMKEDMIIVLAMYYINMTSQDDEWFLSQEHRYKLAFLNSKKISALRVDVCTFNDNNTDKVFEGVSKLHNFLFRKIISKPIEYQEMLVEKLNRLLSGLKLKDCNLPEDVDMPEEQYKTLQYYIFATAVFKEYHDSFKLKSSDYTGFKHNDLMKILQEATELTGGYDHEGSLKRLMLNEPIRCIIENASRAYAHLLKNA